MKKKLVALIIAGAMIFSVTACVDSEEPPAKTSDKTEESSTQNEESKDLKEPEKETIVVSDFLTCPEFTAEKNSTEMVDQIATVAKDNAPQMTDDQAMEIINAIRTADHKFYNGPKEMEKYMWYGYLLDYKYDDSDVRSELGTDLCQAIKYVYRNVETVLDDSTKANLDQIDEHLANIQ